ncbi:hypothetical protein B4U80_07272 [Leptotrombidium deliense]|uniref:Uncharacterized protein n=1 Tax=Leptotrombidium deliense TaxID=299467 RepID=A0A443RWW1_9ACAR|nr:hypothetical protein B4U80_07272 [Leptotrombidium deliense]
MTSKTPFPVFDEPPPPYPTTPPNEPNPLFTSLPRPQLYHPQYNTVVIASSENNAESEHFLESSWTD